MDRKEAGWLGYEKTKDQLNQHAKKRSQKARQEYEANPKFCLTCSEKIAYEKRRNDFCSKTCSAIRNNTGVTRHIKGSKICQCGKPKKPHNKYCSECAERRIYHRAYTLEQANNDKTRRRVLIELRGHRCQRCGLTEWMGDIIPIEVHHVDGNSDNNTDENLKLLCPNCHAQTGTHKRRNKNGARQIYRRKRYAEGKTW